MKPFITYIKITKTDAIDLNLVEDAIRLSRRFGIPLYEEVIESDEIDSDCIIEIGINAFNIEYMEQFYIDRDNLDTIDQCHDYIINHIPEPIMDFINTNVPASSKLLDAKYFKMFVDATMLRAVSDEDSISVIECLDDTDEQAFGYIANSITRGGVQVTTPFTIIHYMKNDDTDFRNVITFYISTIHGQTISDVLETDIVTGLGSPIACSHIHEHGIVVSFTHAVEPNYTV